MQEQLQSTLPEQPNQPATVHETAVRMQEHFALTGAYSAQDVNKVLGDPRDSVSCVVPQGYTASMRRHNQSFITTDSCSGKLA